MSRIFTLAMLIGLLLLAIPAAAKPPILVLHSVAIQQENIVFEVTSYGCSKDADFKLRLDDGPSITLLRIRPDWCKRAPKVMRIKRSLREIGLSLQTPFTVRNPFSPPLTKGKFYK